VLVHRSQPAASAYNSLVEDGAGHFAVVQQQLWRRGTGWSTLHDRQPRWGPGTCRPAVDLWCWSGSSVLAVRGGAPPSAPGQNGRRRSGRRGWFDRRGRGRGLPAGRPGRRLRRLGPPRGQPDCPRCRDEQGRPGPDSGPAAGRGGTSSRAVEGIRGRSGSFSCGLARAVARRSLPRSTGTGPRQRTRPRPTPAWSSFTSPARRVDHQVQLRRRSGAGCPPRPTAPRKWTTHTCILDTANHRSLSDHG